MKTKSRSGLGRGLGSLLPGEKPDQEESTPDRVPDSSSPGPDEAKAAEDLKPSPEVRADVTETDERRLVLLDLEQIVPNPDQPRRRFDPASINELAQSIQAVGVLQPILVRPLDDNRFGLIAGERRWRASRQAGLSRIPAIVRATDQQEPLEQALIENLQRQDLSPLEEAQGYSQLMENYGLTHSEIGKKVGKSRSAVTNAIRLLGLAPENQQLVEKGALGAGHARALLAIDDGAYAVHIGKIAARDGWNVRQIEQAARDRHPEKFEATPPPRRDRPAAIVELEQRLIEQLDTKVKIRYGKRSKGRLEIDFSTIAELEDLYRRFFATT